MKPKTLACMLLGIGLLSTTGTSADSISLGAQINALKTQSKLNPGLQQVVHQSNLSTRLRDDFLSKVKFVTIDASAKDNTSTLLKDLTALGLKNGNSAGMMVSGSIPISALAQVHKLNSLHYVTLSRMNTRSGKVASQGVAAMYADAAKIEYGLDGSGITVGVISDSYDCYSQSENPEKLQRTAEIDKASGDLPDGAYALEESNDCLFRTDEGRALMQIVHDIAPQASLVFLSGGNGIASTINGIKKLVDEIEVDIIVDDTGLGSETYFQDDLISQTIDEAAEKGVIYVTAAGNSGRNAYQSAYRNSFDSVLDVNAHNFSDNGSTDVFQKFSLPENSTMNMTLQWSNPAYSVSGSPGAQTDLDISIINSEGTQVILSANRINISNDPIEFISFTNPAGSGQTSFNFMISKSSGEPPELIKYVIEGRFAGKIEEYTTNSGTTVGRANAGSAISVGAVDYRKTPNTGATSPVLQHFSSAGGDTPILFDFAGERLAAPVVRAKPEIVGPDNVNTTFFNYDDDQGNVENDSHPNFLGTSASAPHVAGVVALLLQLNPDFSPSDIKVILQQSAVDVVLRDKQDMSEPIDIGVGTDSDSGSGYIDALAAIDIAREFTPSDPITLPVDDAPIEDDSQDSGTQNGLVTVGGSSVLSVLTLLVWCYLLTEYRLNYKRSIKQSNTHKIGVNLIHCCPET